MPLEITIHLDIIDPTATGLEKGTEPFARALLKVAIETYRNLDRVNDHVRPLRVALVTVLPEIKGPPLLVSRPTRLLLRYAAHRFLALAEETDDDTRFNSILILTSYGAKNRTS